jgi:hypothetical protein
MMLSNSQLRNNTELTACSQDSANISDPRNPSISQNVELASSNVYPESLPEYEDIVREVDISQQDFHARAELLSNIPTATLRSITQ